MKRVRDTLEFAAGWLTLRPGERIIVAREVRSRRVRHWVFDYIAPRAWLLE